MDLLSNKLLKRLNLKFILLKLDRVWDLNSQSPYYSLNLFGHSNTIRCLHLDGKLNRLVSGSADHTIKVNLRRLLFS